MGSPSLADTSILIDFLKGVAQARRELESYPNCAISVITRIEVLAGTSGEGRRHAEAFLLLFTQIELTPGIAERAADIRRTMRLKLPDAVILATAQITGRVLITRNTRDFEAGPLVRFPYRL